MQMPVMATVVPRRNQQVVGSTVMTVNDVKELLTHCTGLIDRSGPSDRTTRFQRVTSGSYQGSDIEARVFQHAAQVLPPPVQ